MNHFKRLIIVGLMIINVLLLFNCANDAGDTQSTGDIELALVWEIPESVKTNIARRASGLELNEDGTINCEDSNIETIYVSIYNQTNGAFLRDNGTQGWECSEHSGVVQKVPISKNNSDYRKLVCLARDDQDNVIFRGEQANIQVSAENTERVRAKMTPFASDLSGIEDGAQTTEDTLTFQCSAVSNAAQYQLQVATDESFNTIQVNKTSESNTFDPLPFTESNTYYWRICAVDEYGFKGAWSPQRTVTVSLPALVSTKPASQITATSAVLNGTVNQRGLATTYWFEYRRHANPDDSWIKTDAAEAIDANVSVSLEGLGTKTDFEFRVVATNSAGTIYGEDLTFTSGDDTGPEIVETIPKDGAVNISPTTTVRVDFTEVINEDTLTPSTFVISDGTSEIAGFREYNGWTATFTPAEAFNTDTTYHVTLKTEIKDQAGNRLQTEFTWSFTTKETEPPRVISTYPLNSAKGVQVFPTITATFNEPMAADTLNPETFFVNDGTTNIGGTVTYEANTMTAMFLPDNNFLCDTTYTITLTDSIKDNHENRMAANISWHFKTGNNCGANVTAGDRHTLAIRDDGTILTWGDNTYGQLGDGTYFDEPVWAMVTSGATHTVALRTDGSLWAWGSDYYSQLGIGTHTRADVPPTQVGVDIDWASVSIGTEGYHTLALKTDGSLWVWGWCTKGSCGIEPITEITKPTKVEGHSNWTKVSAGSYHSVALKEDKSLWTWGWNEFGQLGDGEVQTYYSMRAKPAQIGTDKHWTAIAAGDNHTIALKEDGSLWAWGDNTYGQLGLGETVETEINRPTRIGDETDISWIAVAAGGNHSLALKEDGTLWSWGDNTYGQVGQLRDGINTSIKVPTKVEGHIDWAAVSAGGEHSIGLKTNGDLWGWGSGNYYPRLIANLIN